MAEDEVRGEGASRMASTVSKMDAEPRLTSCWLARHGLVNFFEQIRALNPEQVVYPDVNDMTS
jgi:hypothetical protein